MKVCVCVMMPDGLEIEVSEPKEIVNGNAPFGYYLRGYDKYGTYYNVNGSLVSRSFIRENLHPTTEDA